MLSIRFGKLDGFAGDTGGCDKLAGAELLQSKAAGQPGLNKISVLSRLESTPKGTQVRMRSGSDKSDKPKTLVLPPSTQHFVTARDGRATLFSDLTRKWKPIVKAKVEEPETQAQQVDDSKLPAYLRQRPTKKDSALFFRTQPSATRKKK
jgi:hypothetical protein